MSNKLFVYRFVDLINKIQKKNNVRTNNIINLYTTLYIVTVSIENRISLMTICSHDFVFVFVFLVFVSINLFFTLVLDVELFIEIMYELM